MRAIVLLLLSALFLTVAIPAYALTAWVTIRFYEGFTSTLVGTGSFTFDTDYYELSPYGQWGGLVPANKLGHDAGIDFFAGPAAGTHLDFTDVRLSWWGDGLHSSPRESLGIPMWNWGWESTAGGTYVSGMDGPSGFNLTPDYFCMTWWDGGVISEDKLACVPEPPPALLFGVGLAAIGLMRNRSAAR